MTRTMRLLGILVALLAVDLWVHSADSASADALPILGGFRPSDIDELAITSVVGTVRIARGDDGWEVAAPYSHDADDALVQGIIAILADGVSPEARVDEGDHERYGLVAGQQVLVELKGVGQVVSALYVGNNAGGGVNFVRIPGEDAVYRARIGGRSRYDRPHGAWRNLQVFTFQPAGVVGIRIDADGEPVIFTKGPNGWAGDDLDGELVAALPENLGSLRATRVMAPGSVAGFDGRVTLTMDAGPPVAFDFGTEGQIGVIRTEANGPLYQVPAPLTDLLADGRDAFADRAILRLDLATLSELVLEEPERTSVIRRDIRTEAWVAVKPATLDIDSRKAMEVARFLATLRVIDFVEVSPAEAGFPAELRMRAGGSTVEFGGDGPSRNGTATTYLRVEENPERIGIIDARLPAALKSGWSR